MTEDINSISAVWKPTHKHLKSGNTYQVLGQVRIEHAVASGENMVIGVNDENSAFISVPANQYDGNVTDSSVVVAMVTDPVAVGEDATLYVNEGGDHFLRRRSMFEDGRFEAI